MVELPDSRLWSTDVYEFLFFNDLRVTLKQDMEKGLILNALSRGFWKFRRLNFINLKMQIDHFWS